MVTTIEKRHFHRLQTSKAIIFLKDNLEEKISLAQIASASGASQYHFIRIFKAYTGETPFSFISRERVSKSLPMIVSEAQSMTDIAHHLGFDSSSAFNKVFKKVTNLSPTEFRNLGKDQRDELIYSLSMTPKSKEITMNFNMNLEPEIIDRDTTVVHSFAATGGEFKDVAPIAWQEFLKVLETISEDLSKSEFFGVGTTHQSDTKQVCNYKAALSIPTNLSASIKGLKREEIPASKYAKFLLKGSYDNVWVAFDKAFQIITDGPYEISDAPCLENYLNDPSVTPEEDLLTEILIPIR